MYSFLLDFAIIFILGIFMLPLIFKP